MRLLPNVPTVSHLKGFAKKENVYLVSEFQTVEWLDISLEAADVIWIISTPYRYPGMIWRHSQILFGNDEKPLCYDGETESGIYKDERVQSVFKQNIAGSLADIVGRVGLNRLPNKTVVLLTGTSLPDITDRPETLLFDWEDFEVAGGLDKLPEVIAERQRFEIERDNLTAESGLEKVEQVLGVSQSQAYRILMKLRGGKLLRVPFREQILSCLSDGDKNTAALIDAIEGHPSSIKNELTRLVEKGEIVKVQRGMYMLPES